MMLSGLRWKTWHANQEVVRRGLVLYTFGNASGFDQAENLVVIKPSGSGVMALLAAGTFPSIESAQEALCLPLRTYLPHPEAVLVYERLYQMYRRIYFALGTPGADAAALGDVLPELRAIANQQNT